MISLDDLAELRRKYSDKKIVLTSGTFDLLHVGHLHYLEAIRSFGDIVVVLLSSDARVKARKGPSRPIIPEDDRAKMLEALRLVDYVLLDPGKVPPDQTDPWHEELITRLQPDLYVTDGPDPRFLDILDKSKLVVIPRVSGGKHASTSAIINHIITGG